MVFLFSFDLNVTIIGTCYTLASSMVNTLITLAVVIFSYIAIVNLNCPSLSTVYISFKLLQTEKQLKEDIASLNQKIEQLNKELQRKNQKSEDELHRRLKHAEETIGQLHKRHANTKQVIFSIENFTVLPDSDGDLKNPCLNASFYKLLPL